MVPKTRTVAYGEKCFCKSAAVLWNGLDEKVKNTKTLLRNLFFSHQPVK